MKKSASSQSVEAGKEKRTSGKMATSLDGQKKIPIEQFDQLFDEGSAEIDAFIDWEKPVYQHGGHRPNSGRKPTGRKPYQIRLRPEIHAKLKKQARTQGVSISELVENLVR